MLNIVGLTSWHWDNIHSLESRKREGVNHLPVCLFFSPALPLTFLINIEFHKMPTCLDRGGFDRWGDAGVVALKENWGGVLERERERYRLRLVVCCGSGGEREVGMEELWRVLPAERIKSPQKTMLDFELRWHFSQPAFSLTYRHFFDKEWHLLLQVRNRVVIYDGLSVCACEMRVFFYHLRLSHLFSNKIIALAFRIINGTLYQWYMICYLWRGITKRTLIAG